MKTVTFVLIFGAHLNRLLLESVKNDDSGKQGVNDDRPSSRVVKASTQDQNEMGISTLSNPFLFIGGKIFWQMVFVNPDF